MKNQAEITQILNCYKKKLTDAVEEKIEFDDALNPEIDIIIFSLVNKIETLLWILELGTKENDLLEQLYPIKH